jgi:hypothetical protein
MGVDARFLVDLRLFPAWIYFFYSLQIKGSKSLIVNEQALNRNTSIEKVQQQRIYYHMLFYLFLFVNHNRF